MLLFAAEDLQLNSGTALGFDIYRQVFGFQTRRLSFSTSRKRLCLSLHAVSFKVLPNAESSAPWLERPLCYAESRLTHDQDHFSDLAVIAMHYQ